MKRSPSPTAERVLRWGALGALWVAAAAWGAACAGPPPFAEPEPGRRITSEPVLRVGVAVHVDTVTLSSPGWIRFHDADTRAPIAVSDSGESWRVTRDEAGDLRLLRPNGDRSQPHARIRAEPADGVLRVNGIAYRGGALVIRGRSGGVTAVNTVALEDYLLGVVPAEIGPRPAGDLAAVKAQAVAARTYALAYLGARDSLGFDVFGDVGDQVYRGVTAEAEVTTHAVRETRGVVATYGGRLIETYYHSTCGGHTAAIEDVWPRPRRPYLVPVSDRIPGGPERHYCDLSPHFRWTERWTLDGLRGILQATLPPRTGVAAASLGTVTDVRVTERTDRGRVLKLEIETSRASYQVWGNDIRWVLEPQRGRPLRSTFFVASWSRGSNGDGILTTEGGGWGHGIGMCQWGAIGRARAGQSYEEILKTYYRGIDLERWY
jgi:stage II sporulation protein D